MVSCLINYSNSGRSSERYNNNKIITSQNIYKTNNNFIRNTITLNDSSYLQNLIGFWFWYGIQSTNNTLYQPSGQTFGYLYNNYNRSISNGTLTQINVNPNVTLTEWGESGSYVITGNQIEIGVGKISNTNYESYLDLTKDFNFWEMVFFY